MAVQSLYRRYRPRRFDELKGQEHVVRALQNAVINHREGQAYLFSGPRGTGKTSTARILAKVLNCEEPKNGEPCGICNSCGAIDSGNSYDVLELDAASNNGVENMRDLIERSSLGNPGRHRVFILDEVHMLSKQQRPAGVHGIARIGHERDRARIEDGQREVCETLLGPKQRQDLRRGIELHTEAPSVVLRDGRA